VASPDKPVWEYADFAPATRKLKAIAEDQETKQRFEKYLEEAPQELWIWAYRERVKRIGKAQLAAYFNEWRIRNPERYAELQRESYSKHYAKNYPRYLANARNWRARKKLADGVHTSGEIDKMVRDQGGVCAYCKTALDGSYHVDHMIPLTRGGRNDWSNLAITCGGCNRSKGAMTAEEFFQAMSTAEGRGPRANFV
jgi:5-methylcytosine-specific restriction endonuclease McrA